MRYRRLFLLGLIGLSAPAIAWTGSHYSLDLRPDFGSQYLAGHARIELSRDSSSKDFVEILSPRLALQTVKVEGSRVIPEKGDTGWRIALSPENRAPSKLELHIEYVARPSPGLVFGEDYVYTAFHTCRWMPCVGTDLSQASVSIALHVPDGTRSVEV
ncbi:MAG: hypothetical protein MPN21_15820 [Thermoanaerobaculia bacterium]|nr:hypothetical protein [Thermoanaerobaculia bacterium]